MEIISKETFKRELKQAKGLNFLRMEINIRETISPINFMGKVLFLFILGKYFWKNGSVYDGDFNHGIRSGTGKWKSSEILSEYDEYEG